MAKGKRSGGGKGRPARQTRVPDLGYYLIFTDTKEIEKNYIDGLAESVKANLPPDQKDHLDVVVNKAKRTDTLVEECLEELGKASDPQYRRGWILFDRDEVKKFDDIIQKAEKNGISVAWSNPCIETWFEAYFQTMTSYSLSPEKNAQDCCQKFLTILNRVSGQELRERDYKNDRGIYQKLILYGDEKEAIKRAERRHIEHIANGNTLPSEMCPCTTVYQLVKKLRGSGKPPSPDDQSQFTGKSASPAPTLHRISRSRRRSLPFPSP